MAARREWESGGVSWRVNGEGALIATWWPNGAYIVTRVFYGYTRRDAARIVAADRRADKVRVEPFYGVLTKGGAA